MEQIYIDRLTKLANHLKFGKLGHKIFNFNYYNDTVKPECGTNGCAIGECPIAFPEYWHFDFEGEPVLIDTPEVLNLNPQDSSKVFFFCLTEIEFHRLFMPKSIFNKNSLALPNSATKDEVADHILRLIQQKQAA